MMLSETTMSHFFLVESENKKQTEELVADCGPPSDPRPPWQPAWDCAPADLGVLVKLEEGITRPKLNT